MSDNMTPFEREQLRLMKSADHRSRVKLFIAGIIMIAVGAWFLQIADAMGALPPGSALHRLAAVITAFEESIIKR